MDKTISAVEVHNVYTLYELNIDGVEAEHASLVFGRPQDWGNNKQWHYHQCRIEFVSNQVKYINNCHLWQQIERTPVEAFQAIATSLFLVFMPGGIKKLCGNTHLEDEDFWSDEWGEMLPIYEAPDELD